MALSFFLSRRNEDNVVDIKDYQNPSKSFTKMLPFIVVGIALTAAALFFLSRLSINMGGLFQRLLSFFPLIRGFLPF
jgi:hypothetical protein